MEIVVWKTAEGQAVVLLGALLLLLLSLLFLLVHTRSPPSKLKLPPSPFPSLPLLGDILHLRKLRSSLQDLRDKLGPIFTLYVGNTPLICITSAALAHEALVQKGLLFAERPMLPSRAIFTNNYRNINSASYGPYWRLMRRNLVQEMLIMPKIFSFKPVRFNALEQMISRIRHEAQHGEGSICIYPIIKTAMFEILLFMCFGFHMPEDAALQISALMEELLLYSAGTLQDFFYYLHIFNGKKRRRGLDLRAKQVKIFTSHFEKHQELKQQGQLAPGSYLETLLNMDASVSLSMDDIAILCTEFLAAGTDTTASALEWAMARVTEDSSIQSRLYNQMCNVVGNKPVEEKDLPHLPYLQAFIKETLRLHPPGNFLLPHSVSKLCKVGGYDIPPNAVVLFNVTFISKDPEIWEEPLKFKPERFLSSDVDITGSKEMTMMPFGAGRRICPGLALASIHMELFVSRLVQTFEWSVFPPGAILDLTQRVIFTVRMKHPLKALVKERRGPFHTDI